MAKNNWINSASRYWWVFCLLSVVLSCVNPLLGYFGIAGLILPAGGYFLVQEAKKRKKRLTDNADVFKRMNRKQKEAFEKLDLKEQKNLESLLRFLGIADLVLLVFYLYTMYYGSVNGKNYTLFAAGFLQGAMAAAVLWILAAVFAGIGYFLLYRRMEELKVK
jgi:hypothetical protein